MSISELEEESDHDSMGLLPVDTHNNRTEFVFLACSFASVVTILSVCYICTKCKDNSNDSSSEQESLLEII